MFQSGEKDLANPTLVAEPAQQGRLSDPLDPRPLALWPAIPALSVRLYRFGPSDVLAVTWQDVRIEKAFLDGHPLLPPAASRPPVPGSRMLCQAPRIGGQGHLTLSGTASDGTSAQQQVVIDPTATADSCGVAALSLEEAPVPGGLRLVPRLSVLTPPDGRVPQPALASLLPLTIGRRRAGQPVLRRPMAALMPDVTALIEALSEALCKAEADWARKTHGEEPAPDWIRTQLLQHAPEAETLAPAQLEQVLDLIQKIREEAGDRLRRVRRTQGHAIVQKAEALWASALSGLVAARLPAEILSSPALLPRCAQTTLCPIHLADGDRLDLAGLPRRMRLEIHLQDDVPRDLGLTLPEVHAGAMRWPPTLRDQDAVDMAALWNRFLGEPSAPAPC